MYMENEIWRVPKDDLEKEVEVYGKQEFDGWSVWKDNYQKQLKNFSRIPKIEGKNLINTIALNHSPKCSILCGVLLEKQKPKSIKK